MKIGIIGLGAISTFLHLPALSSISQVEISAGCDPIPLGRDKFKAKYPKAKTYENYIDMLSQVKLDGVLICTPPSLHFEICHTVLTAGISVFCEKPVGISPDKAEQLIDLAREKNLVFIGGYHNRFLEPYIKARMIHQSGELGDLKHVSGRFLVGGPNVSWEPKSSWYHLDQEGGVLYDSGSHLFNTLSFVTNEDLNSSNISTVNHAFADDNPYSCAGLISYSHDVLLTFNLGWTGKSSLQDMALHYEKGAIIASPTSISVSNARTNKITTMFQHFSTGISIARDILTSKIRGGAPSQYLNQMKAFCNLVEEQKPDEAYNAHLVDTLKCLEKFQRVI
jgi:predicted dehydrogenase